MTETMIGAVLNYGVLGVIAVIFLKSYYEDKGDSKKFKEKLLDNEKQMAVILSQTVETVAKNNSIIKNTESMHKEMDRKLEEIDEKLNDLIRNSNQFEVIQAISSIKELIIELVEEEK